MPWKYSGRVIKVGRSWTDNDGIKHPYNWNNWSADEKAARGLTWEDDPAPYDNRFYWDADTPKALDDVNEVDEDGNAVLDENGDHLASSLHGKLLLKNRQMDCCSLQIGWWSRRLR